MDIHGKAVATVVYDQDKDYGEWGGFTAVLSTPSLDRDGDRLHRDEWIEPLQESYPLDIDHGMSVEDTVGSFHPYFDGDQMMMDAYFARDDKSQRVRGLVDDKHIRSVSVTFLTDKSKKDGEPRRELLNAAIVAIPANRDAIILHSKRLAEQIFTADEIRAAEGKAPGHWCTSDDCGCAGSDCSDADYGVVESDSVNPSEVDSKAPSGTGDGPALTQAIHDASVHLGAMCYPLPEPEEDNTGASDGANKTITFTNASGEVMGFNSHEDARGFFTDMIKSLDDNPELVSAGAMPEELEEKGITVKIAAVVTENELLRASMTQEQFKSALAEILTPRSPEEPAPADQAAAASDADDWGQKAAVLRMRHRLHRN